jgi:hypothetical protein
VSNHVCNFEVLGDFLLLILHVGLSSQLGRKLSRNIHFQDLLDSVIVFSGQIIIYFLGVNSKLYSCFILAHAVL